MGIPINTFAPGLTGVLLGVVGDRAAVRLFPAQRIELAVGGLIVAAVIYPVARRLRRDV